MKEINFFEYSIPMELPVLMTQLDPNDNMCKLALNGVYEEYEKGYKSIKSNVKSVFTSSWFSHKENVKFTPLVKFVENVCNTLVKEYFIRDSNMVCETCWGSIFYEGDSVIKHDHFPSDLSACVYLDLEDNSSNIFFNNTEIALSKGMVLIFPGIMPHKVLPTKGKRVTVAMNLNAL